MLWSPARLTGDRQRQQKGSYVMTGAMYAAIGGLKAHMSKLNVIGNNLANVNTYGYKAQRMSFRESIYTTAKAGSNGSASIGGNNPSQYGYGASVGSIDLNMSPSTYTPTGFGLDCMITGEGFFLVGDKIRYEVTESVDPEDENKMVKYIDGHGIISAGGLDEPNLSRVGDFWVDADGYICNRDNKVLYGFARVQNPYYVPEPTNDQLAWAKKKGIDIENPTIISTELVPLRVPLSAAAPTEENGGKMWVVEIDPETGEEIPDSGHYVNLWEEGDPVYPYLSDPSLQYNRYASYKDGDEAYGLVENPGNSKTRGTGIYAPEDDAGTADDTAEVGEVKPIYGRTQIAVGQNQNVDRVSDELPVQMRGMQIGKDGSISGTAEGQTVVVGYIAIASADSPDGVTSLGGPYYKAQGGAGNLRVTSLCEMPTPYLGNQGITYRMNNDGTYVLDERGNKIIDRVPSSADRIMLDPTNQIQNGGLEASSTDVATEFAEMITAQRGYQVNTRMITVTDSMLEELANMKR